MSTQSQVFAEDLRTYIGGNRTYDRVKWQLTLAMFFLSPFSFSSVAR